MEKKQPEIKIVVSRRIDVDSVTPDNPIFVPVRCGAVFDRSDSPYQGDNTGDNVSEKRMSYGELAVQYWAWKNIRADYVGLCHYRRYLSFSGKTYRLGAHGLVTWPLLDQAAMQRFGLLDEAGMRKIITGNDLIHSAIPTSAVTTPRGIAHSVRELWEAHDGIFFAGGLIDHLLALIDTLAPEYSVSSREYFAGSTHFGYNCFVMRQELFDRLCSLQFPVMEALEKELDATESGGKYPRAVGYAGEMLFGVFVYHVENKKRCRYALRQLVIFDETRAVSSVARRMLCLARFRADQLVWRSTLNLFPIGTPRREKLKKLYLCMTGRNERNRANDKSIQSRT